jgi:mRNA interferase HicA
VKKNEVERKLRNFGWYFLRHGSNHDIWTNGEDQIEVPRHPEINEKLARYGILRIAQRKPGK